MCVLEYVGNIPAEQREVILSQLNKEMERLVKVWRNEGGLGGIDEG